MREFLEYNIRDIAPGVESILKRQGVPSVAKAEKKIVSIAEEAIEIFSELVEPIGVVSDISIKDFGVIYDGDGLNESETPVGDIFPRAEKLALFAITMGRAVGDEIRALFDENEFALAAMLDASASEATELAGIVTESDYLANLENNSIAERTILRYSPGYCGWHISGQRALFERLEPSEIGIELNESFLMQPLKSVSGVMIVGPPEIHNFVISYKFCDSCKTKECRGRIKSLFRQSI